MINLFAAFRSVVKKGMCLARLLVRPRTPRTTVKLFPDKNMPHLNLSLDSGTFVSVYVSGLDCDWGWGCGRGGGTRGECGVRVLGKKGALFTNRDTHAYSNPKLLSASTFPLDPSCHINTFP